MITCRFHEDGHFHLHPPQSAPNESLSLNSFWPEIATHNRIAGQPVPSVLDRLKDYGYEQSHESFAVHFGDFAGDQSEHKTSLAPCAKATFLASRPLRCRQRRGTRRRARSRFASVLAL